MKKCLVVLCVLLSACVLTNENQTEFKNPIFNEWLVTYAADMWDTKLFPNKTYSTNGELELHEDCTLIENETDYVTLMCTELYNDSDFPLEDTTKKYKSEYIIAQEQNDSDCIRIMNRMYNEYGNSSGLKFYCISRKHAKMYE